MDLLVWAVLEVQREIVIEKTGVLMSCYPEVEAEAEAAEAVIPLRLLELEAVVVPVVEQVVPVGPPVMEYINVPPRVVPEELEVTEAAMVALVIRGMILIGQDTQLRSHDMAAAVPAAAAQPPISRQA